MCSIAGIIGGSGIEKMVEIQKHRAPDESGIYKDAHIELGMGRLKIIDLISEDMAPFKDDRHVLCYNGEIYNYIELRAELETKGHCFRTSSDVEVLFRALKEWGTDTFKRLNGMYAFAMYDKKEKKLLLARDIAGEKPLYLYRSGATFAFASESKAFHGIFPLTEREDIFFSSFQHVAEKTLWREVTSLPPAHYAVYDLSSGHWEMKPHWEFSRRDINPTEALEELEALLEDSVRIRTRSDAPYGLYLSKGVDSSIISTLFPFENTFFFDDSDDWKEDFFSKIDKISWHLDFPVGSLSSYPLWKLAERAKKKVKVILSGEGADEIFGGYVRYLPIAREWELRKNFPSYTYLFNKHYVSSHLDSYARMTARDENIEFVREQLRPYFAMFDDPVSAMGFADFKLIMPSLLQMGDRMAGAHGIENRCPFLDRRVIEFGFSLPAHMKISGLSQKLMLRRILEKRGMEDPLRKEKKGLTITFNSWFGRKDWSRGAYLDLVLEKWREAYHL